VTSSSMSSPLTTDRPPARESERTRDNRRRDPTTIAPSNPRATAKVQTTRRWLLDWIY
jgi:hypothetical protein